MLEVVYILLDQHSLIALVILMVGWSDFVLSDFLVAKSRAT